MTRLLFLLENLIVTSKTYTELNRYARPWLPWNDYKKENKSTFKYTLTIGAFLKYEQKFKKALSKINIVMLHW